MFFFFFKPKTAYVIVIWREFIRLLFRSFSAINTNTYHFEMKNCMCLYLNSWYKSNMKHQKKKKIVCTNPENLNTQVKDETSKQAEKWSSIPEILSQSFGLQYKPLLGSIILPQECYFRSLAARTRAFHIKDFCAWIRWIVNCFRSIQFATD